MYFCETFSDFPIYFLIRGCEPHNFSPLYGYYMKQMKANDQINLNF